MEEVGTKISPLLNSTGNKSVLYINLVFMISFSMYLGMLRCYQEKMNNCFKYEVYESTILKRSISLEQVMNRLVHCMLVLVLLLLLCNVFLFNNLIASNLSSTISRHGSCSRLEASKHHSYLNLSVFLLLFSCFVSVVCIPPL